MSCLAAFVVVALTVAGQAEENVAHDHLTEWAEFFAGSWMSESMADEDTELVKKGDKVVAHWSIKWSPDKEALLADYRAEINGQTFVTVKGVTGWDASENAIVGRWFSSLGGSGKIVYTKDGEKWIAKWSTVNADKEKASWAGHTTEVDENTRKTINKDRIVDGKEEPDDEVIAKRK